jgi:hypothetical protein
LEKEAVQIGKTVTLVTGFAEKGVGNLVGEYAAHGRFLPDPTVSFTITGLYATHVVESVPLFYGVSFGPNHSSLTVMNNVLKQERERKPPWVAPHEVWVTPLDRVWRSDHAMQVIETSGAVPVNGHYTVELVRRLK